MNENAKKWVEALRSGKYKQTTGALNKDNTHCCLGVACEVAIQNGVKIVKTIRFPTSCTYQYNGHSATLPAPVMIWLGIQSEEGLYSKSSLMERNDEGWSFKKIAALIEREPKGLFNENI